MKRFIFFTDSHFRDDKPKARIDDVLETQRAELDEIAQLCKDRNIDAILHGGDFFDTKKPSHKLVVFILDWCKKVGLPIYGAVGNHDITGYNLESVMSSGLGVMFESGAIQKLDTVVLDRDKIVIKAVHSTLAFKDDYMLDEKYDDYFKLILSHNYVIPSDSMPFEFVHPKDIKTNANLVLCGHYHVPYDYTGKTTRWVNPGALSRWKITERDNMPTVLYLEVENGKYKLEHIKLKSAKPGNELFDVEAVQAQKKHEYDLTQFAKSLEETSFDDVDIEQVVRTAGVQQGVEKPVLDVILKHLQQAKEVLK